MVRSLIILPLHIIAAGLYTFLAYTNGPFFFEQPMTNWPMPSGGVIVVTPGWIVVMFSMLLLLFEMMKAVQTGWSSVTNNALSTCLFIGAFGLMLTVPQYGTATWLLLTSIMAVDTLAGWAVGQMAAKRDFGVNT